MYLTVMFKECHNPLTIVIPYKNCYDIRDISKPNQAMILQYLKSKIEENSFSSIHQRNNISS